MLTNSALLRIDKYTGHNTDNKATYVEGSAISKRILCIIKGPVFDRRLERLQLDRNNVGRAFVTLADLGGDQDFITRLDRLLIKPDAGAQRFYVADLIAVHARGSSLDHIEIELRDE